MPVNLTIAATLLSWASAFDNRNVTDESVHAWAAALNSNVTITDGKEAVTEFFRTQAASGTYLMPTHVNYNVSSIRDRRIKQHETSEIPPDELADDPQATIAWVRAYRRAIANGSEPDNARAATNDALGVSDQPAQLTTRYEPGPDGAVLPHIARQAAAQNGPRTRPTQPPEPPAPKAPAREDFLAQVNDLGIPAMPDDVTDRHDDPIQCPDCGQFSAVPGETSDDGPMRRTSYGCNNAHCRHMWVQTVARDGWLEYDQRDPRAPHAKTRAQIDDVLEREREMSAARDAIGYEPVGDQRPAIDDGKEA